jgi:uncharacterized protein (TIGR02147 family)
MVEFVTPESPVPSFETFDVFRYETSAALLEAYIEHKKRTSRYFSVSGWAKRLGLPTSGIIINFLKKRRLPPEELAERFARDMGLGANETEYFMTLVAYERALAAESITAPTLRRRLESFRLEAATRTLDEKDFVDLSHLGAAAIHEALSLKGGNADPARLARRLRTGVDAAGVSRLIEGLVASGLLVREPNGSVRVATAHVQSTNDVSSEAVRTFHRDSLEVATRALEDVEPSLRHFSSYVMPVAIPKIDAAKKAIDRFMYEFASEFEAAPGTGDEVYQINLNFVPLTEGDHS